MKTFIALLFLVLLALAAWDFRGFYDGIVNLCPNEQEAKADIIVALTGGRSRISTAARLLAEDNGRLLFISGVNRQVDIDTIAESIHGMDMEMREKIYLGHGAEDTTGNAREVAHFIKSKNRLEDMNIKSALVVTNDYHVPRAMLELRFASPDIKMTAYPACDNAIPKTPSRSSLRRVLSEWIKYNIVNTRIYWTKVLI
ncbi:MAG: YdcF family protein [Alphaproteobacteria bacterium]|nr:YdcF family protein [Alphaproteobacteria bacterium]